MGCCGLVVVVMAGFLVVTGRWLIALVGLLVVVVIASCVKIILLFDRVIYITLIRGILKIETEMLGKIVK